MYYIVNQNHRIIAADSSLLNLLNVKDIDELYTKMTLGDIVFSSLVEEEITISIATTKQSFSVQHHILTSVLGEMILIEISLEDQNDVTKEGKEEELPVIGTSKEHTLSTITTIDDDMILEPLDENIEILQDNDNEKAESEDTLLLLDDTSTSFDTHTDKDSTEEEEELSLLDDTSISFKIDESIEEVSTHTEEEISL